MCVFITINTYVQVVGCHSSGLMMLMTTKKFKCLHHFQNPFRNRDPLAANREREWLIHANIHMYLCIYSIISFPFIFQVGFGNVAAETDNERVFTILMMIIAGNLSVC